MKRISWAWQSPDRRMEVHRNEVTDEIILTWGRGNSHEFTNPDIRTKIMPNKSDAEALGREFCAGTTHPLG